MKNTIIILAFAIILAGCSNPFQKPLPPVYVEIPVAVACPEPVYLMVPDLPIYLLKQGDSPEITAKAYVNTIILLKEYTEKLEKSLEPYRNGY